MDRAQEIISVLQKEGESLTVEDAFEISRHGNLLDAKPAWTAWRSRVKTVIMRMFALQSAPARQVIQAGNIVFHGYEMSNFDRARDLYLEALRTAQKIIEDDMFGELQQTERAVAPKAFSRKAFIVHGRDDAAKDELAAIISEMGLEPIILHRQADGGKTIIEKFEEYADVGYAFVLLTPDEIAYLAEDEGKKDEDRRKEKRARPNVIFEFGYFIGRLGRSRTCCLYKGDVSIPSDINGIVYKRYDRSIEEVAWSIQRDLKLAGYELT